MKKIRSFLFIRLADSQGQHILEYTILFVVVVAAIITMGPYVVRSWNANLKGWEESSKDSMNDPLLAHENEYQLPYCTCDNWVANICGGGHCAGTERNYTRVCNPSGCSYPEKCEIDDTCCAYTNPLECGVNASPACPDGQRRITEECGDNGPHSTCIGDPSCVFVCMGSFSGAEYGNACPGDETGLSSSMSWITVDPGGCDNSRKCQQQCADGFVADATGSACICPNGQIRGDDGNCCVPTNNQVRLYSGSVANCNAGVVTTNPNHLNCATNFIGYACSEPGGTPLYVGTIQNCNAAVVTTNPNHLNCSTAFIGYSCTNNVGTPLYVGNVENCNSAVVTTNPNHLNCSTTFIGYASTNRCE